MTRDYWEGLPPDRTQIPAHIREQLDEVAPMRDGEVHCELTTFKRQSCRLPVARARAVRVPPSDTPGREQSARLAIECYDHKGIKHHSVMTLTQEAAVTLFAQVKIEAERLGWVLEPTKENAEEEDAAAAPPPWVKLFEE